MKTHNNFDERFEFTGSVKTWSLVAIVVGVLVVALGFVTGDGERTFANLLLMGYYFTCVCICGVFFCALQYVAQAGWSASILRIPQAFARTLPWAAGLLILIIVAGLSLTHTGNLDGKQVVIPYLYKTWATKGITDSKNEFYDSLVAAKAGYLNIKFFLARIVGYLVSYSILGWLLVKYSNNEDEIGGMSNYDKSFKVACIFMVIFGFTVPLFAFDAIMSLEARWFSTMFGWYNFAALWVSGLSVITLFAIYLRKIGYFTWITEDHLHNLGQLMFGFSVFWTYLWFAQFLLTYYANIPEESEYFYRRWEPEFKPWFWLNIVVNFATPLLVLMARDSKRAIPILKTACVILILGHWLDYWQMIMPGSVGPQSSWAVEISWIEAGVFVGFAGLFTFAMLTALSKFKSLVPKNHPLLEESLHHHI
ncbi:MAG: quinol:cytochrome C oxidoreductase [Mucilaginibacter sp.]